MAGRYNDQKGLWMMSGEIWFGGSSQDSIDYEIVHFTRDKLKFGIFWRNNNKFITGREWGENASRFFTVNSRCDVAH